MGRDLDQRPPREVASRARAARRWSCRTRSPGPSGSRSLPPLWRRREVRLRRVRIALRRLAPDPLPEDRRSPSRRRAGRDRWPRRPHSVFIARAARAPATASRSASRNSFNRPVGSIAPVNQARWRHGRRHLSDCADACCNDPVPAHRGFDLRHGLLHLIAHADVRRVVRRRLPRLGRRQHSPRASTPPWVG